MSDKLIALTMIFLIVLVGVLTMQKKRILILTPTAVDARRKKSLMWIAVGLCVPSLTYLIVWMVR